MKSVRLLGVVPAVTVAVLLASCGSSPTDSANGSSGDSAASSVYSTYMNMAAADRDPKLAELAKADGNTLSLYTSWTYMPAMIEGFTKKYGIKVESFRGNSETVLQRLAQEQTAGKGRNDMIETNAGEMNQVAANGWLKMDIKSDLTSDLREGAVHDGWIATRFNSYVLGWNTDLVKDADIPTDWAGLADPKFKGKLFLEVGDSDWYGALKDYYTANGMTLDQFTTMFKGIVANSKTYKGHTTGGAELSAGAQAMDLNYDTVISQAAKEKGAPVAFKTKDGKLTAPVAILPDGLGIMAKAEHEAAALLFLDYALSDEGQQIVADQLVTPSSKNIGQDALNGAKTIPVSVDPAVSSKNAKEYDALIRGASK